MPDLQPWWPQSGRKESGPEELAVRRRPEGVLVGEGRLQELAQGLDVGSRRCGPGRKRTWLNEQPATAEWRSRWLRGPGLAHAQQEARQPH